jgi:hypothetical protein
MCIQEAMPILLACTIFFTAPLVKPMADVKFEFVAQLKRSLHDRELGGSMHCARSYFDTTPSLVLFAATSRQPLLDIPIPDSSQA